MKNFYQLIDVSLKDLYEKSEIRIFGKLILEKITGLSLSRILADRGLELDSAQNECAAEIIARLKNHEPIQYILGETEFYGLKFKVNPDVLIPRPETEELVEWVIDELKFSDSNSDLSREDVKILDIGTGSGCIPIAIKSRYPRAEATGTDISDAALLVARENSRLNNVEVDFYQDDILNPRESSKKWDVIVSNPPYIPLNEKVIIDKQVKKYEPHTALFSPSEEPLLFYHKIASYALSHLLPNGKIYFETHKNLAREAAMLLGDYGFKDVLIRTDISGNERMVRGVL